jgi:hypothetical protein
MKTLIVLFIAILAQTLGDAFLKRGMTSVGEVNTLDPTALFQIGVQVFTTPYIWLGIFTLSIFFGLYLIALSWADLSFVVPVTAFGYLHVSLVRWLGTAVICIGVGVVSRTEQRTTRLGEATE